MAGGTDVNILIGVAGIIIFLATYKSGKIGKLFAGLLYFLLGLGMAYVETDAVWVGIIIIFLGLGMTLEGLLSNK
ncbi:hypothetical protein GF336_07760 [Candidatus Woesearchaeota archaeon]|nr:hypothetical protein [Candidatus Woesearchaeota archaeon]